MLKSFFDIPIDEQRAIISNAEAKLGLPGNVIEKDLWVCWLLEQLFYLPIKMAFKGGTSLSKVYGLIDRFSEDVDITIDYRNFVNELNFERLSHNQLKQISDDLKSKLKTMTDTNILPYLRYKTQSVFPDKNVEITLSEDGEKLKFFYPLILTNDSFYLRDHVLIEFGVRNSSEPCEQHLIRPLLAGLLEDKINLPLPLVHALSPVRTFWEKATLIHVECYRKRLVQSPDRLSRHWYDLCMLSNSWVIDAAFEQLSVLESVIQHKGAFFNASYANYEKCLTGNFRLIPDDLDKLSLKKDYNKMREAGMFPKEPPPFDEIIYSLQKLELRINRTLCLETV